MKSLSILIFFFLLKIPFTFTQIDYKVEAHLKEELKEFSNIRDYTENQAGTEAYFTAQSPLSDISVICTIKKTNGRWSQVELCPFSGKHNDLEPFLSPDGLKLYFASNRALSPDSTDFKDYDIWFVKRPTPSEVWSTAKNLGHIVNSEHNEFYPSVAANSNLYFTSDRPNGKGMDDIYFSLWSNNTYHQPVSLDSTINSTGYEFNAFISPDESQLVYSAYNREDGFGSGDLYVSRRLDNGNWSPSDNLGSTINSAFMDYCPFINYQSNTLFLTSRRSILKYSIDSAFSKEELLTSFNSYENGQSRLYKINLTALESMK
jgi:Tol biopolymer transport system component